MEIARDSLSSSSSLTCLLTFRFVPLLLTSATPEYKRSIITAISRFFFFLGGGGGGTEPETERSRSISGFFFFFGGGGGTEPETEDLTLVMLRDSL